jgi:hypothetical protein
MKARKLFIFFRKFFPWETSETTPVNKPKSSIKHEMNVEETKMKIIFSGFDFRNFILIFLGIVFILGYLFRE